MKKFIEQNGLNADATGRRPLSKSSNLQPTKGIDSFIQKNGLTATETLPLVQPQNGWAPLSGRSTSPELFFEP